MSPVAYLLVLAAGVAVDVEVGYSSAAFPDGWNRITAVVKTEQSSFEGELRMTVRGRAIDPGCYRHPLSLPPHTHKRFPWDLYLTGYEQEVEVALLDEDETPVAGKTASLRFEYDCERQVVVVGPPQASLLRLKWTLNFYPAWIRPELLPDSVVPLLSADCIVLAQPVPLSLRQQEALRAWVELGGRLVLFAGRNVTLLRQGLWRELCPMRITGTKTVRLGVGEDSVTLSIAAGELRTGRSFLQVGGESLGARVRLGRGELVLLRFPLDTPRLHEYLPAETMWRALLNLPEEEFPVSPLRKRAPVFGDLASVLQEVAPEEGELQLLKCVLGLFLILLYVIAIGPFDYRRLHRKGRLKRGWLSFLGYTTFLSLVFLIWSSLLVPATTTLGHVVFADRDLIQTYSILRGGETREYTIRGEGTVSALESAWLDWGFRSASGWSMTPPSELRLPVAILTRRAVTSCRRARENEIGLECHWEGGTRQRVRLENRGNLELKNCFLVRQSLVYSLGELSPSETRSLDLGETSSQTFRQWTHSLAERRPDRWLFGATDWWYQLVPENRLLALTFYGRCGAVRSPKVRHLLRQRKLDLSEVLEEGAAVFVGLFEEDLSGLELEGSLRKRTLGIVRIVLEH